jgi:para-aminobenzoate synthetase component 1
MPAGQLPLVERLNPLPRTVDVFRKLAGLPHVVFFDSALHHPQFGRYSFIAADPVEWIEADQIADCGLRIADWHAGYSQCDKFAACDGQLACHNSLPPFQGGWAGLFGYESGRGLEMIPAAAADEFQTPALAVGLYDVVVAFDHHQRAAWIISQGFPERDSAARHERAATRLAKFRERIRSSLPGGVVATSQPTLSKSALVPQHAVGGCAGLTSNFSADGYRTAVRRVIDYIYAGDVFQVNLSQRLLYPPNTSSFNLYCRLRKCNPAPFAAYLDGGVWQVCSASPERFLCVRDGRVETRPIKGTRRRAADASADRRAADELLASEKDRAENVMIVDLERNDLSRTCRADSVRVTQLCGLESYASVHHLVSVVEGVLREGLTPMDLLQTCFPGGSVTGVPKIRAMQIIAELEPTARGPYCGALGYLSASGQMDMSILIRTITSARGWWQIPVGGGIVADSLADAEYAETWHKAEAMLRAARAGR